MSEKSKFEISCLMLLLILALPLFTYNLDAQGWTKLDTLNRYIIDLYLPEGDPDAIVAASNIYSANLAEDEMRFLFVGFGFKSSTDRGQTWSETRLDSFSVLDIVQAPENSDIWYASINKSKLGGVLKSEDGGNTWDIENVLCEGTEQIMQLVPGETGVYYGAASNTGEGFIKTTDHFATCISNAMLNIQSRDIRRSKADPGLLFIAGDNVYDGGVFKSTDDGLTWTKDSSGLEGLRILTVQPSDVNPDYVYCGADSLDRDRVSHGKGIYASTDGGKSWHFAGADGAHVYDIQQHPQDPRFLVAACGDLGVWASAASGFYWEQFNDGLPAEADVTMVAVPDWVPTDNGIRAYCAVEGEGLYLSGEMITSVHGRQAIADVDISIKKVCPQPFGESVKITWNSAKAGATKITIKDILGNTVYFENGYCNAGDHVFEWQPGSAVSAGMYQVIIELDGGKAYSKILKSGK